MFTYINSKFVHLLFFSFTHNQNQGNHFGHAITKNIGNPVDQSKLHTCHRRKARENVREEVVICFGFTSDWLRKWREFFKPITERSNAKAKQPRITFDTQVKTTPTVVKPKLI